MWVDVQRPLQHWEFITQLPSMGKQLPALATLGGGCVQLGVKVLEGCWPSQLAAAEVVIPSSIGFGVVGAAVTETVGAAGGAGAGTADAAVVVVMDVVLASSSSASSSSSSVSCAFPCQLGS